MGYEDSSWVAGMELCHNTNNDDSWEIPSSEEWNGTWRFNFRPQPDPNAMDVNAMTVNKRTELMRGGACFKCKEVGHLSWDCKKGPSRFIPPKNQGYKDAHAQIKAIINALDKEDQAKFYEKAQEQGF